MIAKNQENEATQRNEMRSEPLPAANQFDSDHRTSVENYAKVNVVLSNNKTDIQAKEIVIDVEDGIKDVVTVEGKTLENSKMTYSDYGKHIRPPKTTWVMFQGYQGGPPPDGGWNAYDQEPLDYTPSRNGFIRLVFLIVLIMLLITAAFVTIVLTSDSLTETFQRKGFLLAIPAMICMVALSYALACSPCIRVFPCNIIVLILAVVCMSIICAWVTSRYDTRIVFYAVIATCIVVFVCFLLAFSNFDFTAYMLYIVVIAAAFGAISLVVGIGMMVTGHYMKTLHLVILIVGTVLNVVIFTMELQMIIGGKAIEIGETEYMLAAFLVYTSIIDIFLKLVQIIGIFDS